MNPEQQTIAKVMLAALAPPIPDDFPPKEERIRTTEPWPEKGPGWVREVKRTKRETCLEHETRWRASFAQAMLETILKSP